MVELAATVVGVAEIVKVPEATVTVVDWDRMPHEAVTLAVPVTEPGLKMDVA